MKNLCEENTDFLLVYFCGKAQDKRFSEGFQFDGIQLKIKNFFQNYCDENSIKSIICIFDSCENFIEDNPTELSDEDISNSIMDLKNISESIVVSEKVNTIRTLFEEKLKKIKGFFTFFADAILMKILFWIKMEMEFLQKRYCRRFNLILFLIKQKMSLMTDRFKIQMIFLLSYYRILQK